jgi:hypothetical protein
MFSYPSPQSIMKKSHLSLLSLAIVMMVDIAPVSAQSTPPAPPVPQEEPAPLPTTIPDAPQRGYIGIGAALGFAGSSTQLSTGGVAIFNKHVLSDNLSVRGHQVLFGSRIPSSTLAITLDFPQRNPESGDIVFSPFIGGGIQVRNEDGSIYIAPHAKAGVDLPLPMGVTGLLHLNMAFPANRETEVGASLGVGYSF